MSSSRPVVVITGSSGFIGSTLGRSLADRFEVVGLDRTGPAPGAAGRWMETDITSDDSVHAVLQQIRRDLGARIASVVHLAAYYDFSGEPSPLYEEVTIRGTERLLRFLQEFETVEQFVFSSTMLVHAPCQPGQRINEDWPVDAKWDYPRSKLETEDLLRARHGRIPLVLLRIAGVYDDECDSPPLANQIQRIYERRLTSGVFPGDVSTGQAFVHLDDLVALIRNVIEKRAALPPESTFLVGEEETLSYDELQRMLAWLIHGEEDWDTKQIPKAVAKAGAWIQDKIPGIEDPFIKPWMIDLADDHYELDVARARKMLDWRPAHTLRETLPRMVEALRADAAGFYRRHELQGEPAPAPARRSG